MSSIKTVVIDKHTTSSNPSLHVLYIVSVTLNDGSSYEIQRRYSQFVELQRCLQDSFPLPPKHAISSAIFISAWIKDRLIIGRKNGLSAYLRFLLSTPAYREHRALERFLSPSPKVQTTLEMTALADCVSRSVNASSLTTTQPVLAAYYPTWSVDDHSPESLDFSKFDILFFAFATPNSSNCLDWDEGSVEALKRLVSCARGSGYDTKIVLSVGGWDGCSCWSNAVANEQNRDTLNAALVGVVDDFGLDGIDIDWEYPNSSGAGNPFSSSDTSNLLELMKLLRSSLGESKIISAAVTHHPWLGPDGNPLSDVSSFANVITYVNIMNYDVFGASSKPGPNAPLGNPCGTSHQAEATAQAALNQWTRAGMPANKLLLGLPLYGYVFKSTSKKLHGSSQEMEHGSTRKGAHRNYKVPVRNNGDLSKFWGQQVAFNQLLKSGALVKKSDGNYDGDKGYTMGWDDCSDTPYLFNVGKTTVVSYDDTWSLRDKAEFAVQAGMAGCFTWSLDQDDGTSLHDVVRTSLGRKPKRSIE
ncbi:hypothetical protein AX17_005971 [Amanita inopinata Kibby_2008]|nr:hypothetical protein AX17_005971 [Amanita inopinata Kibby_2008]